MDEERKISEMRGDNNEALKARSCEVVCRIAAAVNAGEALTGPQVYRQRMGNKALPKNTATVQSREKEWTNLIAAASAAPGRITPEVFKLANGINKMFSLALCIAARPTGTMDEWKADLAKRVKAEAAQDVTDGDHIAEITRRMGLIRDQQYLVALGNPIVEFCTVTKEWRAAGHMLTAEEKAAREKAGEAAAQAPQDPIAMVAAAQKAAGQQQ